MSTTARVAVVATVGLVGAFLAFIGIGNGHGVPAAHSATVQTRTYYIVADDVNWDYAPQGKNMITGQPFTDDENVFVRNGPDRIGSTYRIVVPRWAASKNTSQGRLSPISQNGIAEIRVG